MIIVFGHINMDIFLQTDRFPAPGERIAGLRFDSLAGGRAANQALAAARLGGKVALVGKVGDDGPGTRILTGLRRDGVMTSGVGQSDLLSTGAIFSISGGGEKPAKAAFPGANAEITADQIPDVILTPAAIVLLQTEAPPQENLILAERAKARGARVILNLAPSIEAQGGLLKHVDYLIVNSSEARQMAQKLGINFDKNAALLARALAEKENLTCIVTRGPEGAIAATKDRKVIHVPAIRVEKIADLTGTGDAWCGTFAAALEGKKTLVDAMRMASVAASLACQALGAQDSYPYLGDIEAKLGELGESRIENRA